MLNRLLAVLALAASTLAPAQRTYTNPVLPSDYSDPDVIRDGNTFYLVASTFEYVPGIPILSSPDLVHWTIAAHALPRINLAPQYDLKDGNRYGRGVWAPALRKHNGTFFLYFPTPDEGIFVLTAKTILGPWSEPHTVIAGPGLEDPCPFWDDDGQAYLIHSKKGAGPLILHRMSPDGLHVLDDGKEILRDPVHLANLEGPKLYKRNGWYYIFAPIDGFTKGTQVILRSHNLYGPYEQKVVLAQGTTDVIGPHQGGYVEAPDGSGWFMHFETTRGHGRIDHLEPVHWVDDWPLMGEHGQPVHTYAMPVQTRSTQSPQTSDEFSARTLGQQWEWNHNPDDSRWSLTARPGWLRLTATPAQDLFTARNTLTQQMQDFNFDYTVRLDLSHLAPGTHAGLSMFEQKASGLDILGQPDGTRQLTFFAPATHAIPGPVLHTNIVQLRVSVRGDNAAYSFSTDGGKSFTPLGTKANPLTFTWWKAARPAVFTYTTTPQGINSYVDIDWARYRALPNQKN